MILKKQKGKIDCFETDDYSSASKNITESKSKIHKIRSIVCIVFAVSFFVSAILCAINCSLSFSKVAVYNENIKSLDYLLGDIDTLEKEFTKSANTLINHCSSNDYNQVNFIDKYIDNFKEIGEQLFEKIREAERLGDADYSNELSVLNMDNLVARFRNWQKEKLDFIENNKEILNNPNSSAYEDLDVAMSSITSVDMNYSDISEGSEIIAGILELDFYESLNTNISNETTNANNLLIATILLGALALILLIFFFKGKLFKAT